ncbi:type VII toxin-antitoxin system HepT family RNase toxin [Clostridium botulinum]|uniref:type VII toxin-antitoxin system HepT family RNase toxin n=1 Tax=Clostridium botulinum TaxID=1491 RepID=UPI0019674FBC|nr:DUF86 domain-containing protein [Clostridium botulinum]MBN1066035.1 DUF86 domain-containing protein [Clostridium botulinum]
MGSDVIINKIETINRCLNRIYEVYDNDPSNLDDYTKQDSIILNIQRAFEVLNSNKILDDELTKRMKSMVGFRNIAVHDYKAVSMKIVQAIIENHLEDFKEYVYYINKLI